MCILEYKIDINNQSYLIKLFTLCNDLRDKIYLLYGTITDIYFLRRFLDKDYIKNVLTYCGRNHALNYIYFLVKYFNFKITKLYNSNGMTLDDIKNKIKETDDLSQIHNLFLIKGEKPKQCIVTPDYDMKILRW